VHDQIEGDACDIAVVPAGEKEAVTNTLFHYDYRDAPLLEQIPPDTGQRV
jgi:hypothetical protein